MPTCLNMQAAHVTGIWLSMQSCGGLSYAWHDREMVHVVHTWLDFHLSPRLAPPKNTRSGEVSLMSGNTCMCLDLRECLCTFSDLSHALDGSATCAMCSTEFKNLHHRPVLTS